jgi:hypothetical protein
MPIKLAKMIQVGGPVFNWSNTAKVARAYHYEEKVGNSLVVREPIGVVACITPWNFPLNQITLKVAPALAAGCTVVLKPSEIAPVNAMILADIIDAAGLPAGVFNLVNGLGPVVGEVLASQFIEFRLHQGEHRAALPVPRGYLAVALLQSATQLQDQGPGDLHHRRLAVAAAVADGDAPFGADLAIHLVRAGAGSADQPQFR